MCLYNSDERPVIADKGSDFYNYLVASNSNSCTEGATCIGTVYQYVYVFFDGYFTVDNILPNAFILGFLLVLTRFLTWVALKKVR
jgi:hypothetical protein